MSIPRETIPYAYYTRRAQAIRAAETRRMVNAIWEGLGAFSEPRQAARRTGGKG